MVEGPSAPRASARQTPDAKTKIENNRWLGKFVMPHIKAQWKEKRKGRLKIILTAEGGGM